MHATAVVLSAKPVTLEIPGVTVLGHVGVIRDAAELYAAFADGHGDKDFSAIIKSLRGAAA